MAGDKRSVTRADKKTSFRPRHKGGGGNESSGDLLAEAQSRMEAGKYGKAASTLKRILANDPDHWEALRLSATLNLKLGSLFAARSSFESLARKAFDRQDYLVAQSLLKEYLSVVPRYIPFLSFLGQALEASGNATAAVAEYEKALALVQESQDPEQQEQGAGIYQRLKALEPGHSTVKRLGGIYDPSVPDPGAEHEPATRPDQPSRESSRSDAPPAGPVKPWEGRSEPAPFPWEVDRPAGSVAHPPVAQSPGESAGDTEPVVEAPLTLELPATADRLQWRAEPAAPPAPEPPSMEAAPDSTPEPVTLEEGKGWDGPGVGPVPPADTARSVGLAPDDAPDAGAAFVEPSSRAVKPRLGEEGRDVESEADLPTTREPAEIPGSPSWGLRLASEPAPPPAAEAPAFVESRDFGFAQHPEEHAPEEECAPELAEPMTAGPEPLESEPATDYVEPPTPKRRSRKNSPDRAAPVGPTWAAAPAVSETHRLPPVKLFPTASKLRFRMVVFSRRVFSAVQSFTLLTVSLATACAVAAVLGVAVLSMVWIGTEEKPNSAFHNLRKIPAPPLLDSRQNGYRMLTAIGVTRSRDPLRIGKGRTVATGDRSRWPDGFADLAGALSDWYGKWDPAAEFRSQRSAIRQWTAFFGSFMARYHAWVGSPIEDVGYGSLEAPDEGLVLGVHRLYVAEGFTGDVARGIERLRRDAETWRKALAEAKTLRFKMLAAEALNDDLVVASGLMARADFDVDLLPIMAEMSRPMDHAERSLRWPMQHQFALEMDMVESHLRAGGEEDRRPNYINALTYLPLPKQKIFNAYAEYYEALARHDSMIAQEGDPRRNMPLPHRYISAPPKTLSDYVVNPIDSLLVEGKHLDWHDIIGRILETEVRLRLATLQAHIRRPPPVTQPLTRIANAGQAYFDPFTGFTMLLNGSKTILYSVGRDGHDDDGDPTLDVSVPLYLEE